MMESDRSRSVDALATLSVRCPAKLNLALSVGPALASGMHPIASWMVTIDLADDLTLTRLAPDRASRYAVMWHDDAPRNSEIDWPVQSDLGVRAHRALERYVGRALPIAMKLQKRIPVGGGLGGGSSDAAAMLKATNDLFELGLSDIVLAELAVALGSDVPFFLTGGSAVVAGLGEQVETTAPPRTIHAVLIVPEFGCPTGRVYREFDAAPGAPVEHDRVQRLAAEPAVPPDAPFNDLTDAALRIEPRLRGMMDQLSQLAERPTHLCGSGSTMFVICDDVLHSAALASAIEDHCNLPARPVQSLA